MEDSQDPNNDQISFADAIDGVRPLKDDNRVRPEHRRPRPRARQRRDEEALVLKESLAAQWTEGADGEVWYARPVLPQRALQRLKKGQYSVEAELDLHGLNRNQAREELKDFLTECRRRRLGCVRIIHGKGTRSGPAGPVLKDSVQNWLSQWDEVLGYSSASPRLGGTGAVLALLRVR